MDLKAQNDAELISSQLAHQSLSDRLIAMKEAELISLRDSLNDGALNSRNQSVGIGSGYWLLFWVFLPLFKG